MHSPKILILDDDAMITDLLSDILQQEGYEVRALNSSKDVLYLSRQFVPDVLLLDIMMPEIDGYDVCEFFKRDPDLKYTRIIAISARDSRESRIRCFRAGAEVFVAKPFEVEELREIIRSNINSKLAYSQVVQNFQNQSIVDPTANCYNRKYVEKRMAEELARLNRHKGSLALVLVEIENFESIKLRYGFLFGNDVLKEVAESIRDQLREHDLVGRFQDGSFLILLPDTAGPGVRVLAGRLRETISSLIFLNKKNLALHPIIATHVLHKGSRMEDAIQNVTEELEKARTRRLGKSIS